MPKTHGIEEYLEAIYVIQAEGDSAIPSKVADHLGVARPTVTQTVQRMTASGLVASGEGREIVLTPLGLERAEKMIRKHRLLERWLTDELGLDWADAHVEAGRLEHSVSELVEQRLVELLGNPTTCPHGNVIPGSGAKQTYGVKLSQVEGPRVVEVLRILELAEEDLDLLRFFHKSGIVPGAKCSVLEHKSSYETGIHLEVDGSVYALDEVVAGRVLVALQD